MRQYPRSLNKLINELGKLPGIGGKTFRESALPFGEKGVEGQGTLAAAAHAGDNDQPVTGNFHRNVLEVVDACTADDDITFCGHDLKIWFPSTPEG